jgi:uroporphyrinogen III methyltransferase/synthase
VGDVVSLSPKLNWFERKPFFGRKILITRDPLENSRLREILADEAAQVVDWPSYEYSSVRMDKKTVAEIRRLDHYDWLIFTNVRAVEFFLSAYKKTHSDYRALMNVRIAAVGERTAEKLREEKLWVDLIPKISTSKALASEVAFTRTSNKRMFLPSGDESREEFQSRHASRHQIFSPTLYRKRRLKKTTLERRELLNKIPDWILFFSPSAVDAFLEGFKKEDGRKLLGVAKLAVIGKTTETHLKELGFRCSVVAKKSTVDGLLQAMWDYNSNHKSAPTSSR